MTPMSLIETARPRVWEFPVDWERSASWFTGRLAGRLLRCIGCPGAPKDGFKAVEKSTLYFHSIDMMGWQSSESRTVADILTCSSFVGEYRASDDARVERRKSRARMSLGWHMRGYFTIRGLQRSSTDPSERCMVTAVIETLLSEKAAVSRSKAAMKVFLPAGPGDLE